MTNRNEMREQVLRIKNMAGDLYQEMGFLDDLSGSATLAAQLSQLLDDIRGQLNRAHQMTKVARYDSDGRHAMLMMQNAAENRAEWARKLANGEGES